MAQILYIVTGLPFSGKTTLTEKLKNRFSFKVASVDEMLDKGNYVVEEMSQDDWNTVYSQAFEKLKELLRKGKTVIFDGASLKKSERDTLRGIAESLNVPCKLIYLNTSRHEIAERRRQNLKLKQRDQLEDVTMEKALSMFEEPTEDEKPIIFNTDANFEEWVKIHIVEGELN
jgi:predicted kinase